MSGQWQPNLTHPLCWSPDGKVALGGRVPDAELDLIFQLASVSQRQVKLVALATEVAAMGEVVEVLRSSLPEHLTGVLIALGNQAREALK